MKLVILHKYCHVIHHIKDNGEYNAMSTVKEKSPNILRTPIFLAKYELAAIFRPKINKHQNFHKYGHVIHHIKANDEYNSLMKEKVT